MTYTLRLKDNKGYWERWLVTQRIGYEEGARIPPSLYEAFKKGDLALLPRGECVHADGVWWCLFFPFSERTFAILASIITVVLPSGGVAALLEASDNEFSGRAKKAYCFLPLPLKTGLPVHINGHFALDHEARRALWWDEESGPKTDWNFMLMREVIARAYVTLLRKVR